MELIIMILASIIAALTVCQLLIRNSRSRKLIAKIPGPKGFPIIGNALDFMIPEEELIPLILTWATLYYPAFKYWIAHIPIVLISHPDDIKKLTSSQTHISKNFFYDFIHPWLHTGLLMSDGNKWHTRRRMLTPAFHYNVLHDFVGTFIETAEKMVNTLMEKRYEAVEDVVSFFSKYMLNVICETAMGTSMQDDDPVQERYRRSLKLVSEIIFYRVSYPWLMNNWLFSLTRKGREYAEALEILHGFTSEVRSFNITTQPLTMQIIEKRKRYHEETGGQYLKLFSSGNETAEASTPRYDIPVNKKRLAMLDLLIAIQKEHGTIDDLGIREEVDTFVFAGHDTTTMAITFTVLELAEHKDIQTRARAEIDSILKKSNGKLTMSDLQSMEYLDRCIKESLRLYPPVYVVGRKLTEDMHLKNFVVPSGTNILMDFWLLHRDPNFWTQPMVFDPDRFLSENLTGRHPFSYTPFSAGPRNCIGQKYAMLKMKAFLALLLHDFYFEPMTEMSKLHFIPELVLKTAESLKVKFVPVRQ